ncbi:MAG: creatininase family protein [Patescibacteria group bacterium]
MFLERLRTTNLDLNKKYAFVVPMGATEQHGPFLALGADSYLADAIMEEAEAAYPEVIFLPTLRITCSEEHEGFPGTVWVTAETMNRVLSDICNSLKPYAKTIAFASFHGGNLALLDAFVVDHASVFGDVRIVHLPIGSDETEEKMRRMIGGPTDAHAGNVEISMMLASHESLADVPPDDYPKFFVENPFGTNHLKDFSADGIADNHPRWVITKENGKKMMEWTVEDFKNELRKIV